MGFGEAFRDQLGDVNTYTQNGISFLTDFREFLKERAKIEHQYAQAMDQLSKTYTKKLKKTGQSFYGAGSSFSLVQTDAEALGTCALAFLRLLTETETMAKSRTQLADKIGNEVTNALKFEMKRKDEARLKHMAFADTLQKNFDAQKADTERSRNNYRYAGKEVDNAYQKYDNAKKDTETDRSAKEWNDALIEKNDRQNEYILSFHSLNAQKKRYYFTEMPSLMDHLQVLNEHIITRGKEILADCVKIDQQCIDEWKASLDSITQAINAVDPAADSSLFIQHVSKPWTEPPNFIFEPYIEQDTNTLLTHPQQIYLLNTLQKLMTELDGHQKEITNLTKSIDGVKNLYDAYVKDPKLGDPVEVLQQVIDSERALIMRETQRIKVQTQIDEIKNLIGKDVEIKQHQMKTVSSGNCIICNSSMTLFSKGFACSVCQVKCHQKCLVKIPPQCGTEYVPPPQLQPIGISSNPKGATNLKKSPSMIKAKGSSVNLSNASMSSTFHGPTSTAPAAPPSVPAIIGHAKALYDFVGSNEGELTVREGDIVNVIEFDDGNGWLTGEFKGAYGVVPTNYVERVQGKAAAPAPSAASKHALFLLSANSHL